VDDVVRKGLTLSALISLVERARAEVTGVFVPVAIGDEWRNRVPNPDIHVKTVVRVDG